MTRFKTIILLSGGLDSMVLAYLLKSQGHHLHGMAFDYGQKHLIELEHAKKIAKKLGISLTTIDLHALNDVAPSALTRSDISVPSAHYRDVSQKATVVPNRNMIMLSIASAFSESNSYDFVATAVHSGDRDIYLDCRPEFIDAFNKTLESQEFHTRIIVPFIDEDKRHIVKYGISLGAPFDLSYSCYNGNEVPCEVCGACIERNEAINEFGQNM